MSTTRGGEFESKRHLEPFYTMQNPDIRVMLFRGKIKLSTSEATCIGNGIIYLKWKPLPNIGFRLNCDAYHFESNVLPPMGYAKLEIINRPASNIDVWVTNINRRSSTSILGEFANSKTICMKQAECDEVKFHMTNFIHYPGSIVADYNSNNWRIRIKEVNNAQKIYEGLKKSAGYAITHAGSIESKSGVFDFDEARNQLNILYYFFAFLSGRWCGPILSVGFSNGEKSWKAWDVVTKESYAILDNLTNDGKNNRRAVSWPRDRLRLTSGTPGWNWTLLVSETELRKIFEGFLKKWNDESWINPLKTAVFLYVESNQGSGGTEGSIIMVQSALELLTAMESNGIRRLDADERIRQYLKKKKIPERVPDYLEELKNFTENINDGKLADGPRAITYIRNKITHSSEKYASDLQKVPDKIKLQASWLGIWYLEMSLLRLFDYFGSSCKPSMAIPGYLLKRIFER